MTNTRCWLVLLCALTLVACACNADQRSHPRPSGAPSATPGSPVARIVFVGWAKACDCTKERIEKSLAKVKEAMTRRPGIDLERISIDREEDEDEADRLDDMRTIVELPGIYFLDENGALVEMLQGEVSTDEIRAVLGG